MPTIIKRAGEKLVSGSKLGSAKASGSTESTASGTAHKSGSKLKAAKTVKGSSGLSVQKFYENEDLVASKLNVKEAQIEFEHLLEQLRDALQQTEEKETVNSTVRLLTLQIKRQNRLVHFANRLANLELTAERQRVDDQYLRLQNVIHEVQHLQKEIQRCVQFKSADEDIELISVEQFYREAPVDISKPDVTKGDEHELRLARLNYELQLRKQLVEDLEMNEIRTKALSTDLQKRADVLAGLKPQVDAVLEASRPLQQTLNMKYEAAAEQRDRARYLPPPLFHLYLQARAYNEIMDKHVDVTVEGDVDQAKHFMMKRSATNDDSQPTSEESAGEEESVSANHSHSGRATPQATAPVSADACGPALPSLMSLMPPPVSSSQPNSRAASPSRPRSRSKTPSSNHGKGSKRKHHGAGSKPHKSKSSSKHSSKSSGSSSKKQRSVSETMDAGRHELLDLHPLTVCLQLPVNEELGPFCIRFRYLTELQVVTVTGQFTDTNTGKYGEMYCAETLLHNLLNGTDDDNMALCPNPTAQKQLDRFRLRLSEHTQSLGRTYGWAQSMAGLRFPVATAPVLDSQESREVPDLELMVTKQHDADNALNQVQQVVNALKQRVSARDALCRQFKSLEMAKLPPLNRLSLAAPAKSMVRLTKWKQITAEDYLGHQSSRETAKAFELTATSKGWFYTAMFERGEAKLMCLIYVGVAYPQDVPLFSFTLKWRRSLTADTYYPLKQLERHVNCELFDELFEDEQSAISKAGNELLAAQLLFVSSRMDVLLECETVRAKCTPEFTRDHLYLRLASGPTRELPFQFDEEKNAYM